MKPEVYTIKPKLFDFNINTTNENFFINLKEDFSVVLTKVLVTIIGTLVFFHFAGILAGESLGEDHFITRQLLKLFYLDREYNVPSWFSSSMLCLASLFLFIISTLVYRNGWEKCFHGWF